MTRFSVQISGLALAAGAFFFGACSNSVSPLDPGISEVDFDIEPAALDMYRVAASGKYVLLGTDDKSARVDERNQMRVNFDYDFAIGAHEVTCGEFNDLMHAETGLALKCEEKQLPASNVTYYDAVLFANARSKAASFDTAYTYTNISLDNEGHCIDLEGLAFHPEADAFRLPTEAEWVLSAFNAWNPKKDWVASNSSQRPHPVCTSESTTKKRPCDMAGNVMEWVNDWSANFKDTALVDYVGASNGGSLGKRVIKGGSYQSDVSAIKLYRRGDVYTVTSSTRAAYLGFRLAYGAIPSATWMGDNGSVAEVRINLVANATTIKKLTGTYKTKLVFRNDVTGNLAFVDYSWGTQNVTEIVDTLDSYHPDVSPDGNRVAFCTGLEGVSGKSSLYVRNLDRSGGDLVKLEVESAAIPRWRVLDSGDTVIVYVSSAANNKDASAFIQTSTWQVPFANGRFGEPQKLFDGAYHGGVSEDNRLAVTGARLLRARVDGHDTVWYNAEQACNASLSQDGSKRTLFLDFAGETGRNFSHLDYGVHEMLLVADSAGVLVQAVPAPVGYSFDHTEWSSEKLVSATLTNASGAHEEVVLVNLYDSSVTELVHSEELWHPCVWIKKEKSATDENPLDVDSAGVYYVNGGTDRSKILRYRMELFWKYKDKAELIALGSSRMSNGFDPSLLRAAEAPLNLSYFPNNFFDILHFYETYIRNNCGKLKYFIFSLDLDFWNEVEDGNFFNEEYKSYPGYVYDINHNAWRGYNSQPLYDAAHAGLGVDIYEAMFLTNRSSMFMEPIGWEGDNPIVDKDSTWFDTFHAAYLKTLVAFEKLLSYAEQDGVTMVGVIFPQSPGYKNTGAFGRHGLRRSDAASIMSDIQKITLQYPSFILMDENKMGNHDYSDDMAQDCDHLGYLGAAHFTHRLDSLLQSL